MSNGYHGPSSPLLRRLRKYFVSTFVVFTFVVYAVHERLAGADTAPTSALVVPTPTQLVLAAPTAPLATATLPPAPTAIVPQRATATALPVPTATALPVPTAAGRYQDGTYTGNVADAYWGTVQVSARVAHGQLAEVTFLDYPHDRRTSARINNVAMPYLTSEAIQAQSAEVDLISGATLTSQAFVESLGVALQTAQVH